ncbi:MAG: hypothetical protein HYV60_08105 [Planctomycetia bacterium]|nr:hypothetical protein [Planctomycetia bacterium]
MAQVQSTLRIEAILKGRRDVQNIEMVHFERKRTSLLVNPPDRIALGTEPRAEINGPRRKPRYLMFLRLRKDGRYEPITGHLAPNASVVRLLLWPDFDPALDDGDMQKGRSN